MCDRPDLIVDSGDLPATARQLRDFLAHSGRFFDRGVPVKVVHRSAATRQWIKSTTAPAGVAMRMMS